MDTNNLTMDEIKKLKYGCISLINKYAVKYCYKFDAINYISEKSVLRLMNNLNITTEMNRIYGNNVTTSNCIQYLIKKNNNMNIDEIKKYIYMLYDVEISSIFKFNNSNDFDNNKLLYITIKDKKLLTETRNMMHYNVNYIVIGEINDTMPLAKTESISKANLLIENKSTNKKYRLMFM